jgi:hypothetical protein
VERKRYADWGLLKVDAWRLKERRRDREGLNIKKGKKEEVCDSCGCVEVEFKHGGEILEHGPFSLVQYSSQPS